MFERFEAHFIKDEVSKTSDPIVLSESFGVPQLKELFLRFEGASFNRGLYRVVGKKSFDWAVNFISSIFPIFGSKVVPFGYDWLGRIFTIDSSRNEDGLAGVVMFEPGTGEVLEIPCNILAFHNNEVVDYCDAALALNFHARWLSRGGSAPALNQCVGYKQPLFLGGSDVVENLELADLEVYWTLSGELIQKVRELHPGMKIDGLKLSD